MKKNILFSIILLFVSFQTFAHYDYRNSANEAPVLGFNWGFVGGGFTAMLNNRDDIKADERLNPEMMNFNWAAGAECIYWFQPTIGFGGQLLYWNAGAKYTGEDTLTKYKFSASTKMTYLKLPLMFYFKSYNRYYPNRRTRLNVGFGPYIALLNVNEVSDGGVWKDTAGNLVSSFGVSGGTYSSGLNNELTGKINGKIFNPIDIGFVFQMGGEVRLWKRTVVSLVIRTDVGMSNVENTKGLKIKYDGVDDPEDFNYWGGLYAKYTPLTDADKAAGIESNRRATKNFSVGTFLSIKKYF